ncbi:MAG: hypothetical protein MK132_03955 [Lentisphaerales bacterium]|nr:hypothetical protein [Lentisphaerales bacterium]
MSEYYEYEEEFDEIDEQYVLSEDDIWAIQEVYRRKKLIDSLIGPVISTVFHVGLIIILAILITDQYKEEAPDIEIVMQEVEEVQVEEPPAIEEPEPEEVEEAEAVSPVLTVTALENVEASDTALEDVNDEAPSTEDDSTIDAVSDVVISPSAFASPSIFGGRSAGGRASAVAKFGGSKAGQANLLKALWWLAKVQNPNGSWGEGNGDVTAITGLALLTFLAHGETQISKDFGMTVQKAMDWLAKDPVSTKSKHAYPHAIKSYAIAEAYAMTGVSMLESKMNECIRIIIDGQQEGGCFDYNYKLGNERQDLSFGGWNYQALKAAYGAGCQESGLQGAIYKGIDWLKKISADGEFCYTTSNNDPQSKKAEGRHSMRAVGVLCLQLFGEGDCHEIKDDLQKISTVDLEEYNWKKPPTESLYGWYYATQTMFQAGGPMWKNWNRKFQKVLNDNQHSEGYWPWPIKCHGVDGDSLTGKVYATTLCALQLTVYYRYLPSGKGGLGDGGEKKVDKPLMVEEEGLNLIE